MVPLVVTRLEYTRGEREKSGGGITHFVRFRQITKPYFAKAREFICPLFPALNIFTHENIRPEMEQYPKDRQKQKLSCMKRRPPPFKSGVPTKGWYLWNDSVECHLGDW